MLTLLSVDDMLGDLVALLESLGLENNTYIFYTSDHGYHLGQFGILKDKRLPYETDLRVPGYVRGPTIRPGSKLDSPVLNIDFAPSFLELAGVKSEFNFDGQSFASQVLFGPSPMTERSFLVEYNGEGYHKGHLTYYFAGPEMKQHPPKWDGPKLWSAHDSLNNTYDCVRTEGPRRSALFCTFSMEPNFYEWYPDIRRDPWQTTNEAADLPNAKRIALSSAVDQLKKCRAESCRNFTLETF